MRAGWRDGLVAALGGLVTRVAAPYLLGALMIGARVTMCEDQCEVDRLAAAGRKR